MRRSCDPRVGLVRRRAAGGGASAARRTAASRSRAACRLRQLLAVLAGGDGQDVVHQPAGQARGQPLPLDVGQAGQLERGDRQLHP